MGLVLLSRNGKEKNILLLLLSSLLAVVKISWLCRINCPAFNLSNFVMTMYPEFVSLSKIGGEYANIFMQRIQSPFWRDVLKNY